MRKVILFLAVALAAAAQVSPQPWRKTPTGIGYNGGTVTIGTTVLPNNTIDIRSKGGACDNATDNTAAIAAAHAALVTMGGGTVLWPVGKCLIPNHVVLPNDGVSWGAVGLHYTRQVPIRWEGSSPDIRNGFGGLPDTTFGGTVWKMTYAGTGATGPVQSSILDAVGSGYAVNDTGTLGGTCSGTAYKILAVTTAGAVTNYSITAKGTACTVSDRVATTTGGAQAGVGTGLTLDITNVTGSDWAKLETYGMGMFEIDHGTMWDPSGSALPFIHTTGTTINAHDMSCVGLPSGVSANQDCFVLGGQLSSFSTLNDPNAPFQGYDTQIHYNYFNHIRRAVLTQAFISATYVHGNFVGPQSGSNLTEGAPFEAYTPGGALGGAGIFVGNRVEITSYVYGFKFLGGVANYLAGNDMEDASVGTSALASIRFAGISQFNTAVVTGAAGILSFSEDSTSLNSNTVIDGTTNGSTAFASGVTSSNVTSSVMRGSNGFLKTLNTGVATVSTSFPAGSHSWCGNYWNGSASAQDCFHITQSLGTGANPTSALNLTHTGTTGAATLQFPFPLIITGSSAIGAQPFAVSGPQNYNEIRSVDSGTSGTMFFSINDSYGGIGTKNNYPVVLIVNNSEKGRVHNSGGFSLGSTSDPGTPNYLAALTTPASAAATGVAGTIAWDANFVYICTATNTWKRVAIATW